MSNSTPIHRTGALVRRAVVNPARALVVAAAVLVVPGVFAAIACRFDLAIIAALGVQVIVLALLVLVRRQSVAADEALRRRLDESDRRVLGDVSRARQAILDAIADAREGDAR